MDFPRLEINQHLMQENVGLFTTRQTKESFACLASQVPASQHKIAAVYDRSYTFPLYLYPVHEDDPVTDAPGGRRPNLAPEFVDDLTQRLSGPSRKMQFIINGCGDLKKTIGPEDIFHYMYAVFHAPTYRKRYADFLKIDFPRLPLTSNIKLFRALCALGHTLTSIHLMNPSAVDTSKFPQPKYPVKPTSAVPVKHISGTVDMNLHQGGGGDIVEKVEYKPPTKEHAGRVWINKHQYFEGVPPEVWDFHVGGYQVCEKWLKDRKGRTLSFDDKEHYKLIVAILAQTMALMAEIDKVIDKHSGWPIK